LAVNGEMQLVSKKVRSLFPSGVTIIATLDADGAPHGFTASSFSWLSRQPPLVVFCLACDATSFPVFAVADGFSVNILQPGHQELAMRFATKGIDKFAGGEFLYGDGGYPALPDALVTLQCRVRERMQGGGHLFVVGEVTQSRIAEDGAPMVLYGNAFQTLP
jgi:flavin reductase ActVB